MRRLLAVLSCVVLFPAVAGAQASIAGVVRDTSGAVLPGVTVEAESPVLIERVRSAVTDGTGQFRIENLRPGAYVVTFALPGFATVRREGIQLTGTFVASVNAEMRVGGLEETITVTGETPTVDVQSTLRQRVLDQEVLEALPANRSPAVLAGLAPGVTKELHDVGGTVGEGSTRGSLTVRGVSDARMLIGGVSNHSGIRTAHGAYNVEAYSEMTVDTGGVGAEHREGGVRINLIPRDGGNTFSGSLVTSFANDAMAWDNFSDELRDRGLGTPNTINKLWDINPSFGGPIRQNRIWFHSAARYVGAYNFVPQFFNVHAGNPNVWIYEPDSGQGAASNENRLRNFNQRITWQATPRHKIAFTFDTSHVCDCPRALTATISPEAHMNSYVENTPKRQTMLEWTAPLSNRLLIETNIYGHWTDFQRPDANLFFDTPRMIRVTEQSTGLNYRGTATATDLYSTTAFTRAVMSYVTGAHAFKVGFNGGWGSEERVEYSPDAAIAYRFNNGVPNRVTLHARPFVSKTDVEADHGLFAEDRWTVRRLTATLGLRYDYFRLAFPEQEVGPTEFTPNRHIVFPKLDGMRWHDISPRAGLAFNVFGDGRTALKASLGKYLAGQFAQGELGSDMAPVNRLVTSVNRSWNDANGNFATDCDLLNPAANGECGAMDNLGFGSPAQGRAFDPDVLSGWGKRGYNWQFSTGVQHEIVPRVSVDVSYWRTWFGNFFVNDDRAIGPADFDEFSITAPVDPRLPGGGGYVVGGLYNIKPAKFGVPADTLLTYAKKYGDQSDRWHGVDLTLSARPRPGFLLQGGTTTERRTTDNCDVVTKLDNPSALYCHVDGAYLTQFKMIASATIPRVGVQVTGSLQSVPGPELLAEYVTPNAAVVPSLGRNLSGGERNVTVNLLAPRTTYGDRLNQIDVRVAKILQLGGVRATGSLDLYNLLNSNTVLAVSNAYATWLRPQGILNARFAKVNLHLTF